MRQRSERFNRIIGNSPVGLKYDADAFWTQAQLQAKLILEEAQEQYDAAMERDILEVLDGACDVRYLQDYMDVLLEAVGIDIDCAKDSVCLNNDQKYTVVEDMAKVSQKAQQSSGVDCYIDSSFVGGSKYYTIKRTEDGKVLKFLRHVAPDMSLYVPKHVREFLGDV